MPSTSHSTLTAAMGVAPVLGAEVGLSASRPDTSNQERGPLMPGARASDDVRGSEERNPIDHDRVLSIGTDMVTPWPTYRPRADEDLAAG